MQSLEDQRAEAAGIDPRGHGRDADQRHGGDADAADDRRQRERNLDLHEPRETREAEPVGGVEDGR